MLGQIKGAMVEWTDRWKNGWNTYLCLVVDDIVIVDGFSIKCH